MSRSRKITENTEFLIDSGISLEPWLSVTIVDVFVVTFNSTMIV